MAREAATRASANSACPAMRRTKARSGISGVDLCSYIDRLPLAAAGGWRPADPKAGRRPGGGPRSAAVAGGGAGGQINRRPQVVRPPVEPVVLARRQRHQLPPAPWPGHRPALEVRSEEHTSEL